VTDGRLMDADCVHGVTWYECAECERADLQAAMPDPGEEPLTESYTCPRCGRTSYHPDDIREGYCGACHDWTRNG
jgi:ribosomal protein S27AE